MKLVLDMNLSPRWANFLNSNGIEAFHWSSVGRVDARDSEIMAWARDRGCAVFTHDLDFGIALALTRESGPSVIQIRSQNIAPEYLGGIVLEVLRSYSDTISRGALVIVDEAKARVRILPIG